MIHQDIIGKQSIYYLSHDSVLAKVVWAQHTINLLLLQMEDVYVVSSYKGWI